MARVGIGISYPSTWQYVRFTVYVLDDSFYVPNVDIEVYRDGVFWQAVNTGAVGFAEVTWDNPPPGTHTVTAKSGGLESTVSFTVPSVSPPTPTPTPTLKWVMVAIPMVFGVGIIMITLTKAR